MDKIERLKGYVMDGRIMPSTHSEVYRKIDELVDAVNKIVEHEDTLYPEQECKDKLCTKVWNSHNISDHKDYDEASIIIAKREELESLINSLKNMYKYVDNEEQAAAYLYIIEVLEERVKLYKL